MTNVRPLREKGGENWQGLSGEKIRKKKENQKHFQG